MTRILATDRLVLTPVTLADLEPLHGHWNRDEVQRYLWDGEPVPLDEVRRVIEASDARFAGRGAPRGSGLWAIRPAEDALLVGCVGFAFFHEPPELELVISLDPSLWGSGLAYEAASRILDYAFDDLGWSEVQAAADAPNRSSLALLARLGMRPVGTRPGAFGTIEVVRIRAREWSARKEE